MMTVISDRHYFCATFQKKHASLDADLKTIIMKKFIIVLAAVIAAFGFSSCEKEAEKAIVGTWKAIKAEISMGDMKMETSLSEMGGELSFTFEKDGTGYATGNFGGELANEELTYSVSGNKLYITIEGETEVFPITIDGKYMTMTFDENFTEEEGMSLILHFEKQ
jgi:hypothetical protein